jgi:hypothetical protein
MSTTSSTPSRNSTNTSFGGGGVGGIVVVGGKLVAVVVAADVEPSADAGGIVFVEVRVIGGAVLAGVALTATVLTGVGDEFGGPASGPSAPQLAATAAIASAGPNNWSDRIPRVCYRTPAAALDG